MLERNDVGMGRNGSALGSTPRKSVSNASRCVLPGRHQGKAKEGCEAI
jgi:hypothetical protein